MKLQYQILLLLIFHMLNVGLLSTYVDLIKRTYNIHNDISIHINILSCINTIVHSVMFVTSLIIIIHEDLKNESKEIRFTIFYLVCSVIILLGLGSNIIFISMYVTNDTYINNIRLRMIVVYASLSLLNDVFMICYIIYKKTENL